jgi:hypothetical protein
VAGPRHAGCRGARALGHCMREADRLPVSPPPGPPLVGPLPVLGRFPGGRRGRPSSEVARRAASGARKTTSAYEQSCSSRRRLSSRIRGRGGAESSLGSTDPSFTDSHYTSFNRQRRGPSDESRAPWGNTGLDFRLGSVPRSRAPRAVAAACARGPTRRWRARLRQATQGARAVLRARRSGSRRWRLGVRAREPVAAAA